MPKKNTPQPNTNAALDDLLRRGDVWRGHSSAFIHRETISTGHSQLDGILQSEGWPLKSLIEAALPLGKRGSAQALVPSACWFLLGPSLRSLLASHEGYIALLNPPAQPFAQGLIQQGIPLNRLLIVNTQNKSDFVAAFTELTQTDYNQALIAWQPKQALSYTELRKCQLACNNGQALNLLFRQHLQQSSPSPLRIQVQLHAQHVYIQTVKQKGQFKQTEAYLPLPSEWQSLAPYKHLLPNDAQTQTDYKHTANDYVNALSGTKRSPNNLVPITNTHYKSRRR